MQQVWSQARMTNEHFLDENRIPQGYTIERDRGAFARPYDKRITDEERTWRKI